jgi:autotransporter translocation and assembly factor TamB
MRYVRILVVVLLVVVAALAAMLFVLGWTPAGVRLAAQWLSALSDGAVAIEGAGGRLTGPLRAEAVEIRTATLRVRLRGVVIEWRPQVLRDGELHVPSLSIEEIAIAVIGDDQASPPPSALQLPFPVHANDIAVGRVVLHRKLALDDEPRLIAEPLRAGFDSDGRYHRIVRLETRREQLTLTGDLSLDGVAPFALQGGFQMVLQHPEHAARVDLAAGGSLTAIALEGSVHRLADPGTHEGRVRARLALWGTPWLEHVAVDWPHLDTQAFDARFPRSDVHLVAEAVTRADGWLAGTAKLDNAAAGPLDRGQWPMARVRARFATDGQNLRLSDLVAMVGRNELRGEAALQSGALAVRLDAPALPLSAIHSAAGGEAGVRLRVAGDWRHPSGEMVLSSSQLTWMDRWRARGVSARLQAHGDGTLKLDANAEHVGHSDFDWNPGARLALTYATGNVVVSGCIGDTRGEITVTELRLQRDPQGETALAGRARLRLASAEWLGPLIADDLVTGGRVQGEVALAGTLRFPFVEGTVTGEELMLASKRGGMRLVRGSLALRFDGRRAALDRLHFADGGDEAPPRRELAGIGAGGVEATGEVDWASRTLRFAVSLDRVAVLQKKRQWMRLSGKAEVSGDVSGVRLAGRVRADGGAITLESRSRPQLSRDVIVGRDRAQDQDKGIPATVDVEVDLGGRFWFSGAGLDTRLAGALRFRMTPGNPVRATGVIRSEEGHFDAYGQRLAIARGILAFQGDLENPALDVAAERVLPSVTVGVEVTGTARDPRVKLVSSPSMSEAEKLSWLVLGKGLSDVQPGDSSILLAAGAALFSGESENGTLARIQQQIGLQVGVRTGSIGTSSVAPRSRVVDTGGSRVAGSDIVTVSTQLVTGVSLGYEQVVGSTENVVRLSWALTRALSLEVRSGSANAVDLFYTFSFGR